MQSQPLLRLIPALLALMFMPLAVSASGVTAKERQEAFAWLDSLEYPSLAKRPFIRIVEDAAGIGQPAWQYQQIRYGFLLSDDRIRPALENDPLLPALILAEYDWQE